MPTPKPPTLLTPGPDETVIVQGPAIELDDTTERPIARVGDLVQTGGSLPSLPVPLPVRSPDQWAAEKGTPDWALAAARARHLVPGINGRAGWLENGVMTEAAFDEALDRTLNGEIR